MVQKIKPGFYRMDGRASHLWAFINKDCEHSPAKFINTSRARGASFIPEENADVIYYIIWGDDMVRLYRKSLENLKDRLKTEAGLCPGHALYNKVRRKSDL